MSRLYEAGFHRVYTISVWFNYIIMNNKIIAYGQKVLAISSCCMINNRYDEVIGVGVIVNAYKMSGNVIYTVRFDDGYECDFLKKEVNII